MRKHNLSLITSCISVMIFRHQSDGRTSIHIFDSTALFIPNTKIGTHYCASHPVLFGRKEPPSQFLLNGNSRQ